MKTRQFFFLATLLGSCFIFQSCTRSSNDLWEDTKSAGRHMGRGMRALGGVNDSSRQIRNRADFECVEDENYYPEGSFEENGYQEGGNGGGAFPQDFYSPADSYAQDFIPLQDPNHELMRPDMMAPPPRETPGEQGSSVPGIQAFRDPSTIPELAGIFHPIYFSYDSSLIKGQENLQIIHNIAEFLRQHPYMYIFIEGHTDERGPQAYNLALGSRRANAVRNMLIGEGIHPDRLFTISYGKERPVILEHHEEGWSKNRRAEFKIYER